MMRAGALLLWALCCSFVVLAQEPATPEKPAQKTGQREDQPSTIRVDTDLVVFDVKVVNRASGLTATGLKEEDFAIYEDGVKQQISLFSAADAPLSIALVVDTSGSAKEEVSLMRRAARRFLDELRPRDRISVVSFNQDVELLADLTADRKKAERALDQLDAGRGTSFYDALMLTVNDVLKKATGRKAIVVLTDGVDSYGFYTYQQILPALEKAGAAIYFLELDTLAYTEERILLECTEKNYIRLSPKQVKKYTDSFKSFEDLWQFREWCILLSEQKKEMNRRLYELAHNELREMATRTGGRVYGVRALKDLDRFYAQVAAELRTQYSLGYYPTNEKHDGKWRKLRVELRRHDLVPETKPGYRAPVN